MQPQNSLDFHTPPWRGFFVCLKILGIWSTAFARFRPAGVKFAPSSLFLTSAVKSPDGCDRGAPICETYFNCGAG
jgi:hypothetical protein